VHLSELPSKFEARNVGKFLIQVSGTFYKSLGCVSGAYRPLREAPNQSESPRKVTFERTEKEAHKLEKSGKQSTTGNHFG